MDIGHVAHVSKLREFERHLKMFDLNDGCRGKLSGPKSESVKTQLANNKTWFSCQNDRLTYRDVVSAWVRIPKAAGSFSEQNKFPDFSSKKCLLMSESLNGVRTICDAKMESKLQEDFENIGSNLPKVQWFVGFCVVRFGSFRFSTPRRAQAKTIQYTLPLIQFRDEL
jgi:hypothetical protein